MTNRLKHPVILLAVSILLAGAVAGRADWLLTQDGHRVETHGEWRLDGELVLFELPTGGLVSMRVGEVDLEASRMATERAQREAEIGSQDVRVPVRRESVFRLTDADVGHVTEDEVVVPSSGPVAGDGDVDGSEGGRGLVVTEWSDGTDLDADGLLIVGILRNESENVSGNIRLVTRLFDVDGAFIASAGAWLSKTVLPPGGSAQFRVEFSGVFTFFTLDFETERIEFQTAEPASGQDAGENVFEGPDDLDESEDLDDFDNTDDLDDPGGFEQSDP